MAEPVERRLAAVLAADVAGYSRMMGVDEIGTLSNLKSHRREVVDPAIAEHHGRIVKTTGDGMLVEFASAVDAVTCAMGVQAKMEERNASASQKITFRIGINVGDIIIDGDDIFGDGVNLAARIENECEPGRVYLSDDAFRQVRGKTGFAFDDLGERSLKNIDRPVRLYAARIATTPLTAGASSSGEPRKPLALPDKPSIAVLPFQNMSGDPEQEYFADGIVEDIITALSRFNSLFVIARNSSFTYKGKHFDVRQVGRELGVRYVLSGSIRKSGDRLRATAQLIDAGTGAHIWADTYDRMATDVFDVQDDITRSVVGAIEPSIRGAEIERARRKRPGDLDAYDLYLRALPEVYSATCAGNDKALELLNKALATDPNFAPTATTIAICLLWRGAYGWGDMREIVLESRKYAELALRLDNENSDALAILARGTGALHRYDEGVLFSKRAVTSNPNSALAWSNRGWVYAFMEQPKLAKEYLERALRLSPRDPFNYDTWVGVAIACVQLEQDEQAVEAARTAIFQNSCHAWAHRVLALSLALGGRREEAQLAMTKAMEVDPAFTIAWFKSWNPFIHGNKRYVDGFQLAGFPEQ